MPKFDIARKCESITRDLKDVLRKAKLRKYPFAAVTELKALCEKATSVTKKVSWEETMTKKIHFQEQEVKKWQRQQKAIEKREKKKQERKSRAGGLLALENGTA